MRYIVFSIVFLLVESAFCSVCFSSANDPRFADYVKTSDTPVYRGDFKRIFSRYIKHIPTNFEEAQRYPQFFSREYTNSNVPGSTATKESGETFGLINGFSLFFDFRWRGVQTNYRRVEEFGYHSPMLPRSSKLIFDLEDAFIMLFKNIMPSINTKEFPLDVSREYYLEVTHIRYIVPKGKGSFNLFMHRDSDDWQMIIEVPGQNIRPGGESAFDYVNDQKIFLNKEIYQGHLQVFDGREIRHGVSRMFSPETLRDQTSHENNIRDVIALIVHKK